MNNFVPPLLAFSCISSAFSFGSETLQSMTLEEKVGQVLIVHFHGTTANEEARRLIQDTKVGGVIYYNWANELSSPEQVKMLSLGLQILTKMNPHPIPLLITTDQEGGIVARLNNGFTQFPGNKALGMTGDPDLAEQAAYAMGQEMSAVGINMNLAPVVDVNINPRNPVIGIRSFGDNPVTVLAYGKKALDGYNKAKIITTLKHFPGHGDVEVDSHEDLPMINKSIEELERVELLPFAGLGSAADAIMTAHLLVPAFDAENCSTVSQKTLSYLKNKIGFKGVIISDSLVMEGILKKCQTVDEAAIQALNAGCDILILGGKQLAQGNQSLELTIDDIQRIHSSISTAVKTGRIAEARLNDAVEKILKLKGRYIDPKLPEIYEVVNTPEHRAIAQMIASKALQVVKIDSALTLPLNKRKICIFAPQLLSDNINQTSLSEMGTTTDTCFYSDLNPSDGEVDTLKQRAEAADALIVYSYNTWKNPSQVTLIQSLLNTGKPLILLVIRDPLDAALFPRANIIINTFSPTSVSIQATCDLLNEKFLNFFYISN